MRRRALTIGGFCCCGALALLSSAGPALAGGGENVYFGPVDQVDLPGPGARNEGTIELSVYRRHHHDGSATAQVASIKIVDVNLQCEDGSWVGAGLPAGGRNTVIFNAGGPMYIKAGRFAEPKGFSAEGEAVAVKGTVSRRRAAGTLKISLHLPPQEPEIEGEPKRIPGTCRSGPLHWSATLTH